MTQNNEVVVFFSGFERTDTLRKVYKLLQNGFPLSGVLVSYLSVEPKTVQYLKKYKNEFGVKVMLDSGAFSLIKAWYYLNGQDVFAPSKKAIELIKLKRLNWYFKKYLAFVKKHAELFDVYVELDLQMIVGDDKVNEWRTTFQKEGLSPVLVWHGESIDKIDSMLQYSDHFGLPWRHPGVTYEYMMSIVRYVRRNTDGWIHWFGMTKWSDLRTLMLEDVLNSADSTSWLAGQRYGNVYIIDDGKIVSLQISPNRQRLPERRRVRYIARFRKFLETHRDELIALGLDYDKIYQFKDWEQISFYNLYLYNKLLFQLIDEFKSGKRIKHVELGEHMVEGSFDFSKFQKYKKLDEWLVKSDKKYALRKDQDIRRWLT